MQPQYTPRVRPCRKCGITFTALHPNRHVCDACKQAICVGCGVAFERDGARRSYSQRYCSWACRNVQVEITCQQCKTTCRVNRYRATTAQFCSRSCQATALLSRLWREQPAMMDARRQYGVAQRSKIARLQRLPLPRCQDCGRSLRQHASVRCHSCENLRRRFDIVDAPGGVFWHKRRSGHRTNIEAIVEAWLLAHDVPYLFEERIGRYFADFLIPARDLVIDCDGVYWHQGAAQQARDARKDAALRAAGYTIIRLPEVSIHDGSFVAGLLTALGLTDAAVR